jgi:tRNA 2-selenouridine synthase
LTRSSTRSPAEYAEDHILRAISAPVLDDAERAKVGTLYKQASVRSRKMGAALSPRTFPSTSRSSSATKPKSWHPLVYCWRGERRRDGARHARDRLERSGP